MHNVLSVWKAIDEGADKEEGRAGEALVPKIPNDHCVFHVNRPAIWCCGPGSVVT